MTKVRGTGSGYHLQTSDELGLLTSGAGIVDERMHRNRGYVLCVDEGHAT